jgi:hypothetical protein
MPIESLNDGNFKKAKRKTHSPTFVGFAWFIHARTFAPYC